MRGVAVAWVLVAGCHEAGAPGPRDLGRGGGDSSSTTCADGFRDGDESDVDCGGSCAPCADGSMCGGKSDCAGGHCNGGICGSTAQFTFSAPITSLASTGGGSFALFDLDGDGRPDVVQNELFHGKLVVALGQGNGSFVKVSDAYACGGAGLFAVGDLNGDGLPDLASAQGPALLDVLIAEPAARFTPATYGDTGDYFGVALADLDGDGALDAAVADREGASLRIFAGNGKGGFAAPIVLPSAAYPASLASGDFDGDGNADLAVGAWPNGGTMAIHFGLGNRSFAPLVPVAGGAVFLRAADLDGDGRSDLVRTHDTQLEVLLALPNRQLAAPVAYPLGGPAGALAVADLDGDGALDIAVTNGGAVLLFRGTGGGAFVAAGVATAGQDPGFVEAADLDGDGRIDLVLSDGYSDQVEAILNLTQ